MPSARRISPARTKSSRVGQKISSTLPGHESWTYGGARGIFAESPNRVFLLGGGELPNIPRPPTKLFPEIGPNVQFPLAGLPWRNANTASPPGAGGRARIRRREWRSGGARRRLTASWASTARWDHCIVVVDAQGNIIEEWTQWDKMFKRPHAVYSAPTTRRSMSGWSTTTRMRSTNSRTTASSSCRRSARPTCPAPMAPTSTGRRSWRGCPTEPSTWPTAITARASRSSTRGQVPARLRHARATPGRKRVRGI